jgi:hypothetical protein
MTNQEYDPTNLTNGEYNQNPRELIKFADYNIGINQIDEIRGIEDSLLDEISRVVGLAEPENGWNIDSLGELIGAIGKDKDLQNNIPEVEALMPGADGKEIAISFVEQSGLLEPVRRNFYNPQMEMPSEFDSGLVTGGVRNWMMRRANQLIKEITENQVNLSQVVLASGQRPMGTKEGPDVIEGDTESSYMERVIKPKFDELGVDVKIVAPETKDGNELAQEIANSLAGSESILLACNAGNWVQNGGQIARAVGPERANSIYVSGDEFPVAKNNEPPATHQNPLTALGVIARNLQEFKRHERRDVQ